MLKDSLKDSLPQFLVVGAAKAGTTSIFNYLNQHPDIFIPERKECRFFSQMPGDFIGGEAADFQNDVIRTIDEYQALFAGHDAQTKGDVSNDYLFYYEKSILNIKKHLGDQVKILIILRNPVERAYSNYLHAVRLRSEQLNFEEALIAEYSRKEQKYAWPLLYVHAGMYYEAVKAYSENFKNIKIYLKEDLQNADFFHDILDFLELSSFDLDTNERHNSSWIQKSQWLDQLIFESALSKKLRTLFPDTIKEWIQAFMKQYNSSSPKPMKEETSLYLKKVFYDDINKLQTLIDRDLSHWIQS